MKVVEKLALEHVEKATHPEGDPHFRRAIKATWEAGFRTAREMAARVADNRPEYAYTSGEIAEEIRQLGEEQVPSV